MLIDLSCPAEIFRVALPTEQIPAASLLMYNLSDRVITSAEVTVRLLSDKGDEKERLVYRGRALNGRPHSTFTMNVPCTPAVSVRSSEVTIEKVWFSDNDVWRRESGKAVDYIPNELPVSRGLTALKYVAGETAVGYPSEQNGLWVCVCGRPNPDSEGVCIRCGRGKEEIFTRFNREAVEKQVSQKERQLELQSRSAREDTARMQREREEEYNIARRRRARRIRIAAAMILSVVLVALTAAGAVPYVRMIAADRDLENGSLEEAEKVYADLGGFPGAEERLANVRYLIAARDAESSSDPDELYAASLVLRSYTDREGAEDLAMEADLRRAQALLAAKDYRGAMAAAEAMPDDWPGVEELKNECVWSEAKENMDGRYYVLAREAFLTLGSYREADILADECIYLPALAMMESGQYDAAITQLSIIPAYADSAQLVLKCYYLKAEELEEQGIGENTIRLSIGTEHIDDILADLQKGFDAI